MIAIEGLGACAAARRRREGALPYWRPLWDARAEERAFLDGDRYVDSENIYNKDRRREQFRGQETSNVNRHKAAVATAAPLVIEGQPVEKRTTPEDVELGVSVMESEIEHPQKGFADVIEDVVTDAIDCRAGAAMLEYNPELGEFGESYWRWREASHLMFEPGFSDPHHLDCNWLHDVRRMRVEDVKAMGRLKGKARWRVPDDLRPDGNSISTIDGATQPDGSPRADQSIAEDLLGVPGAPIDDEHIWVLFEWIKNDRETYLREKDRREIPADKRYIACDNPECAYREQAADELVEAGELKAVADLPEFGAPCPLCGSETSRRDVNSKVEEALIYPKGRKLVVMPLLQSTPDDEPFYEGAWPVPTARSFPILWITAYARPGRPMGDSDTTRNWQPQQASDQLMTMAFDRIMRHQMYYGLPQVGIYDVKGNRFEFRDDQFNTYFYDTSNPSQPAPEVRMTTGSALDPAWPAYWNAVQNVLLSHQGIADFGITPDSSKNIPVGTVERINQVGEIPVAQFIRRKNRQIGKALDVHYDYIRYTWTSERLARMRIEDETIVAEIAGMDLPNLQFTVSEVPEFAGLDEARQAAFTQLYELATTNPDPEWVDLFAEINKYPPSVVRKVKRKLLKAQAEAQAAADAGVAPPGGEMLPPEEGAAPMSNPFQLIEAARRGGAPVEEPAEAAA